MHTLYYTPRSPFARRIRVALRHGNIPVRSAQIEAADLFPPLPDLLNANPVGQVPTLITPEGVSVFDSPNILCYLDKNVTEIWPRQPHNRILHRNASTTCTAVLTAALREFFQLNLNSPFNDFQEDNLQVIRNCFEWMASGLGRQVEFFHDDKPSQAAWDLGIAIQYLEFRFAEKLPMNKTVPSVLCEIYNSIKDVPAFNEAKPS